MSTVDVPLEEPLEDIKDYYAKAVVGVVSLEFIPADQGDSTELCVWFYPFGITPDDISSEQVARVLLVKIKEHTDEDAIEMLHRRLFDKTIPPAPKD